ncbi:MAG: mandelate racemase/muconate lactonizing enzyme family protein [Peptococcaceae bacterium]|jgi:L-alanine-DL-glutamate epimerase-like enolase superfamily enzyme|nr:mandelate racemase/muconate lactonizing enzyme family protein [Peptococcaceae bacterium]
MTQKIAAVEVYMPVFRAENPAFDSSFVLKSVGHAVVRIVTDDGLDGYGMTFAEPIGEYVKEILAEVVVGQDPLTHEDIWNSMYRATRSSGRKGLALMAISAIDIALWDLKGKILGQPIYRLLGGGRRKIPAYASVGFLSMSSDEVAEKSLLYIKEGYRVLKIKVGYDGGKNLTADIRRVERLRREVGGEIEIIVDANGAYDVSTAIRLAKSLAELGVCLFEEPVPADDIQGLRRVRDAACIPIAAGENEYTKYGCRDLLLAEAVDVLQFDITRAGGFTEMIKISAMTQAWNLRLAPHFWPQLSAHLLSPAPHGLYLEAFPAAASGAVTAKVIKNQPPIRDGHYELPDAPGLGLSFDHEYLKQFRVF